METTKEIEVEGKKIVLFDAKFPNATGKELEAMVKTCTDLAETGDFTIIQVEIIESDYGELVPLIFLIGPLKEALMF